jgi:glycosyltransferase involved in cell wall biosynthesis
MVAIANELPKVEFVLAGQTGARSEDYIRKLTAANVAGNLAVRTSIDDLTKTQLLESSSVFLNTSVNETFGLTLLEAVLAGAYPIAHASGGPLEYLPAQHLFRTPEEAVHLIGNAIERELDVPADLVERARQIADPDRFERDIRAATEHAFLARRR